MDRVSARSFRALDLAEHGLRELARSRIDTTRDVVFQPLGARYAEAREDAARVATSSERTRSGRQTAISRAWSCECPPALTDRLAALDPRAVEARIEEATRAALARELPTSPGRVRGPVRAFGARCRRARRTRAPELPADRRRSGAALGP